MDVIQDTLGRIGPTALRTHLEFERDWKVKDASLAEHFYKLILEQIAAVVPISILLLFVMRVFFDRGVEAPGELAMGMAAAIVGLSMFVDALRVCVMPLSEQLGTELPKTLTLPYVLGIAGFLGVLVTYAEPAITTLRPLAELVDIDVAPYLYCILMEQQETLILCIGLGVGCAATLGTLRFVRGWSLKPMILWVLSPTLMCAIYMWWGNVELRPLLGLAWDCGAVTTGPVTVPVLLALGIGVMKTKREEREAAKKEQEAKEAAKNPKKKKRGGLKKNHENTKKMIEDAGDALEGFGIVTLASLLPVLAVEILSISLTFIYTHEDIIAAKPKPKDENSLLSRTPFKEVYYSSRAILPLIICLVCIVLFILKKPLPKISFYLKEEDITAAKPKKPRNPMSLDKSRKSIRQSMEYARQFAFVSSSTRSGTLTIWDRYLRAATALATAESEGRMGGQSDSSRTSREMGRMTRGDSSVDVSSHSHTDAMAAMEEAFSGDLIGHSGEDDDKKERQAGAAEEKEGKSDEGPTAEGIEMADMKDIELSGDADRVTLAREGEAEDKAMIDEAENDDEVAVPVSVVEKTAEEIKAEEYWNYMGLLGGVAEALMGMILFSIGLTYGFTSIGDQVGVLLPAAFIPEKQEELGLYAYSYSQGVMIALGTMFCLGFMATRAEPALNVVGQTVEKLSKGSFTCNMLVYSVCVGVGTGMCVGATKILFGAPLIVFILLKYAVALVLSNFANEDFINIAWDSAGVTTGPVTVPFVLATGVGCSKAVEASEGFGILACASVWPIITVLIVDAVRRILKRYRSPPAVRFDA